ncbi:hypothetical protein [Nocardia terpenica]|uniref:Terpene synthase n=1 Tax=Nocardia terpenica TaxID=455432 RepID=A0A6G9ZD13_9NOCA|nr:hypothetical protein [Nocardia terpenica]QIS23509.1 hypothetical protein F6W96_39665 [Nocardia terpenica]
MTTPLHRPGNRSVWVLPDSTWQDMLGSMRRQQVDHQRQEQLSLADPSADPADPTQWWVSEEIDKEAIEVGFLMLETIAPTGPLNRNRTALAALAALTAINDSYAACENYEDIFGKHLFGRPIGRWMEAAGEGATGQERTLMEQALRVQYETLAVQRTLHDAAEQVRRNREDYREYLRWRDAEGCFYGVMLFSALAAGIDLNTIPPARARQTLEAGIVAFDVHSMNRHRSEDETGDIFRYLLGDHHTKVDTALELIRDLHIDLIHAPDLGDRQKEFLLRYMTGGTLLAYMPKRWSRTTALHLAPIDAGSTGWTHITGRPTYTVGFSQT